MSNNTYAGGAYTLAGGIDPVADIFLIQQASSNSYKMMNRNVLMGVTGQPADISTAQTISNKSINNTNLITLLDTGFVLQDNLDTTKQAFFQLSGITTATTRTYTLPNASSTLVDLVTAQTLTNKTLISPVITGGSIDNSTITVDSIAGHTSSTTVSVAGLSITSGVITTANSVTNNALQTGILTSKFSNPYKFSVYRTAAMTTLNANTLFPFDTKTYDTGSNVDVVTNKGRFTAPIAGFYFFTATVGNSSLGAGGQVYAMLYKNGSIARTGTAFTVGAAGSVALSTVSGTLQLNTSDFIEVYLFGGNGNAAAVGSTSSNFDGYLVSAT